ncbi:MAG: transporter [Gammaproteobacteria bacterium]
MKSLSRNLFSAAVVVSAVVLGHNAGAEDLGEAATNPVSNLIQFRLQDQYTPSSQNADGYANAALIQTVVPLPGLASRFESLRGIVTRTTVGYVSTPRLPGGIGRRSGLGDTSVLAFAVPKAAPAKTVWGFGPALTIPTAGDNDFTGAGQWQAGPAAVVMVTPKPGLQVGGLVFHQWDFADTRKSAQDVSTLYLQPILTKHFDKGWYVAAPDTPSTYNFETKEWALNLGAVLGRVFPVGGRPMQIFGGLYYNPIDNDESVTTDWTVKFQLGWLFPQ